MCRISRLRLDRVLCLVGLAIALWLLLNQPVQAESIDPFVLRYLKAADPVELPLNAQASRTFSGADLSEGKRLFEDNCKNCHVGGTTLPDPTAPLSLAALQSATPPRDTIDSLVAFLRQPMTYDGSEETYLCRQIPESWLSQPPTENLAAFVLRSAQKAPGWGTAQF